MDVDDRLRFTIDITRQSIYWSGGPTAEAPIYARDSWPSAPGPAGHSRQPSCQLWHSRQLGYGPIVGYGGDFTKYT
jgi:hypothetical protein